MLKKWLVITFTLTAITACGNDQNQTSTLGTTATGSNDGSCDGSDRNGDHHGRRGKHRKPPAEALAACKDLATGAACSVKLADRTIDGTCHAPRDNANAALACRPNPPAEAVAACANLAEDADCSFVSARDGRTISGKCHKGPEADDPVVCHPARPPHPEGDKDQDHRGPRPDEDAPSQGE